MFANTHIPPILSHFSSTSSEPLALFSNQTDTGLPEDSFIWLLNDASDEPKAPEGRTLVKMHGECVARDGEFRETEDGAGQGQGHKLCQTVLHIQSPSIKTTYIQTPSVGYLNEQNLSRQQRQQRAQGLGIPHPWIHLQVRNLGKEWSFEVGVCDTRGVVGVVRCSTFQKSTRLHRPPKPSPPILHLPFSFPTKSSYPVTSWTTVSLDLNTTLARFQVVVPNEDTDDDEDDEGQQDDKGFGPGAVHAPAPLPSKFAHIQYIRVYANCRLRRIWTSETRKSATLPWEFTLYASE